MSQNILSLLTLACSNILYIYIYIKYIYICRRKVGKEAKVEGLSKTARKYRIPVSTLYFWQRKALGMEMYGNKKGDGASGTSSELSTFSYQIPPDAPYTEPPNQPTSRPKLTNRAADKPLPPLRAFDMGGFEGWEVLRIVKNALKRGIPNTVNKWRVDYGIIQQWKKIYMVYGAAAFGIDPTNSTKGNELSEITENPEWSSSQISSKRGHPDD